MRDDEDNESPDGEEERLPEVVTLELAARLLASRAGAAETVRHHATSRPASKPIHAGERSVQRVQSPGSSKVQTPRSPVQQS